MVAAGVDRVDGLAAFESGDAVDVGLRGEVVAHQAEQVGPLPQRGHDDAGVAIGVAHRLVEAGQGVVEAPADPQRDTPGHEAQGADVVGVGHPLGDVDRQLVVAARQVHRGEGEDDRRPSAGGCRAGRRRRGGGRWR